MANDSDFYLLGAWTDLRSNSPMKQISPEARILMGTYSRVGTLIGDVRTVVIGKCELLAQNAGDRINALR